MCMLNRISDILTKMNIGPKATSVVTTLIGKNRPARPMHAGHTPTKNANTEPIDPLIKLYKKCKAN